MDKKIKENVGKILYINDFCFTILHTDGKFYLCEVDFPVPDKIVGELLEEILDDSKIDWANVTFDDNPLYPQEK